MVYREDGTLITEYNSAITDGSKNVTTAGTAVKLIASSTTSTVVFITAKAANTGVIWVGGSTVEDGRGTPLYAGDTINFEIDDLNKIYIDSTVNGEGVTFTYLK